MSDDIWPGYTERGGTCCATCRHWSGYVASDPPQGECWLDEDNTGYTAAHDICDAWQRHKPPADTSAPQLGGDHRQD